MTNLLDADTHFQFGENWSSYAESITTDAIEEAEKGLLKLVSKEELQERRFIDIGCGSGLHALAAHRQGASHVYCVDIDKDSVETSKRVLDRFAPESHRKVENISVFDLSTDTTGSFDIVYSWGVLHHTGDLDGALRKAAALVAPNGLFIFALYRRTALDAFWKLEKKWYTNAPSGLRRVADTIYISLYRLGLLAKGTSFSTFLSEYKSRRGMDFYHDVRDWLGGFPYESITPSEVDELMRELGLRKVRTFTQKSPWAGLFGSGCDEFVYARD